MDANRLVKLISTRIVVRPHYDEYNGRHWRIGVVGFFDTTIYEEIAGTREKALKRADDFQAALGRRMAVTVQ